MTIEEIKIRQMTNQYLLTPGEKITVVRDLLGVQAQFMSNAIHALKIRCRNFDEATFGDDLVKNWSIRGTIHIFAQEDLSLLIHCHDGKDCRRNEWNDQNFWNQRSGWAMTPARQKEFSQLILSSLKNRPLTREELKEICVQHGMTEAEESSMFDPWGGGIRLLCERGFMHYAVQEKKIFCLSPEFSPLSEKAAALEMAKRYFANYGPATIHDAMYFFHATAAQVKQWLDALPVKSVLCDGREYFYIENNRQYDAQIPNCLFLAGFDPLMLGYEKKESLYLFPADLRRIFNLAGIVLPALMLDGNVMGKWKRQNKRLVIDLFREVNEREKAIITETANYFFREINKIDFIS